MPAETAPYKTNEVTDLGITTTSRANGAHILPSANVVTDGGMCRTADRNQTGPKSPSSVTLDGIAPGATNLLLSGLPSANVGRLKTQPRLSLIKRGGSEPTSNG